MDAVPVALPQALQNCAPEPIGDPHLSQNIDRSSVCYKYAMRARKVSFGDPPIAIQACSDIARMVPNGTSPFNAQAQHPQRRRRFQSQLPCSTLSAVPAPQASEAPA